MDDLLQYNIYDIVSGRITKIILVPPTDDITPLINLEAGQSYDQDNSTPVATIATDYYPAGVRTTRPMFTTGSRWNTKTITADGVEMAVFGPSLPNNTNFSLFSPLQADTASALNQVITDGTAEFTTTVPGIYNARIQLFPYQDYQQDIYVVPDGQTGFDYEPLFTMTFHEFLQRNPYNDPADLIEYNQTLPAFTDNINYREQVNTVQYTQTLYAITDDTAYREQIELTTSFTWTMFDVTIVDSEHFNVDPLITYQQTLHSYAVEDGHTLYPDTIMYNQDLLPFVDVEGAL